MNHSDSGHIKILVLFPGNSILEFWLKFWNCVVGTHMRGRFVPKSSNEYIFLHWSFWSVKLRVLIRFHVNPRNFHPRNFKFLVSFSFKTIFAPTPTTTTLVSKDVEFSCASFDICEKFAASCPLTQTPTQKFKIEFPIFRYHEIGSS